MSDTLTWGAKWETFSKWVDKATGDELKEWLGNIPISREWAYKDEMNCVKNELKRRKSNPTPQDIALKAVRDKMKEAGKYRLRASHLVEKAQECVFEATLLCPHPPQKVVKWYYLNYEEAYCGFHQCLQCGLREEGSYSTIFTSFGKDYGKILSGLFPDEAKDTYTRTATEKDKKRASSLHRNQK